MILLKTPESFEMIVVQLLQNLFSAISEALAAHQRRGIHDLATLSGGIEACAFWAHPIRCLCLQPVPKRHHLRKLCTLGAEDDVIGQLRGKGDVRKESHQATCRQVIVRHHAAGQSNPLPLNGCLQHGSRIVDLQPAGHACFSLLTCHARAAQPASPGGKSVSIRPTPP